MTPFSLCHSLFLAACALAAPFAYSQSTYAPAIVSTQPASATLLVASNSSAPPAEALPDAPSYLLQQSEPRQQPPSAASSSLPATEPAETPAQTRERLRLQAERELKAQKSQRILGVVPNFNTVLSGQAVPLTPRQKFSLALRSSLDPYYFGTAFLLAGYSEIDDTHQGYHWGASGYFKRAGANYADTFNGALIGNALLPALLKQDPRYFRQGTGSIKSRMLHSALSTVICRGDNGKTQPNYSNVLGNFISGAISNIYYPSDETGLELTLTNGVVVTAEGAIGAQLLEFAPDLVRLLHRHQHDPAPTTHTP